MNTTRIDGPGMTHLIEGDFEDFPPRLDSAQMYDPDKSLFGNIAIPKIKAHISDRAMRFPDEAKAVIDCLVDHGDGPCTCQGFGKP